MAIYFKMTEISNEEFVTAVGTDLGTYSQLGTMVGNSYYGGVDDEVDDRIVIELDELDFHEDHENNEQKTCSTYLKKEDKIFEGKE
jgi:hypothetical protein